MSTVILRSTGPQNNPGHFTPEVCAKLKKEDPLAYTTSVLAEFGQTERSFVDPADVDAAANERPNVNTHEGEHILSCDPSHLLGRDGWAVVVTRWISPRAGRQQVLLKISGFEGVYLGPAFGEYGEELFAHHSADPYLSVVHAETMPNADGIEGVSRRLRSLVSQYQIKQAFSDYGSDLGTLTSLFNSEGVVFQAFPWSSAQRAGGHQVIGRLIADRRIHISQLELREQLKRIKAVLQPSGTVTYTMPRSKTGGHCDLAAALITHGVGEFQNEVHNSPIAAHGSGRREVPGS